jgi:uroporphyrinogen III methyltransferase/synthase
MSTLNFGALAKFPGTIIFYMGVTRVGQWSRGLIQHGMASDTPVAIVRWCSWPRQQTLRCTLATVAEMVRQREIRPPALFIVGKVVARAPELSWFAARPLSGVRVLVTGSPETSQKLRQQLSPLGADVIVQPAIRIADPLDWAPVDAALERLDQYDWLVFSSQNGVDYFIQRLLSRGRDLRDLGPVRLATIGSGTAGRLSRYHLQADLLPEYFRAESLADALADEASGRRFLLIRASRGRELLADRLRRAGAQVDQVVAYRSIDVEQPDPEVAEALSSGQIDWVTVASSAAARSLSRLYGDALRQARLASISPVTSEGLRQLGYEPAAEASPHTMSGLVDVILRGQPLGSPRRGSIEGVYAG